jgi:hypothetical protein
MDYKLYIHHHYTYELFWYFCHGLDINPNDVPVWFKLNQYNKNIKIDHDVIIDSSYKGKTIQIIFCFDNHWDKLDGFHLLDYSISLLENNTVGDRGFNANDMFKKGADFRTFLNEKAKILQNRLHFMYIDWEGHDAYNQEGWAKRVNKNVEFFVDETYTINKKPKNSNFVFTNLFWSFIYPNTLGIREYYFFHDYLKYKNDYKYKINIPVRRVYGIKKDIIQEVLSLNNPNINCTRGSFHESKQYHLAGKGEMGIPFKKENYIQKRGYAINDWGGEWNDNNMSENMWKMFGISEVVILFEVSAKYLAEQVLAQNDDKIPTWMQPGDSMLTEKTISHILIGKPFIPQHYDTILFLNNILKQHNGRIVEYPIKEYDTVQDIIPFLDNITRDDKKWKVLADKLKLYVENLRTELVKLCSNTNSYFDLLIKKELPNNKDFLL